MKIWIAKYALTTGVYSVDAQECGISGMMKQRIEGSYADVYHSHEGRDWFGTEDAARAKAGEMIQARIKSLRGQLDKAQRMWDREVRLIGEVTR